MKKVIAIALLGTLSHLAPVQAQEINSTQTWASKHGAVQSVAKQNKPARLKSKQYKPGKERYTRPISLHQAGSNLESLEKKRALINRDLRRAQRHNKNRAEARILSHRLIQISHFITLAKRDYHHYLKLNTGGRKYRLSRKHKTFHSSSRRSHRGRLLGHNRSFYSRRH